MVRRQSRHTLTVLCDHPGNAGLPAGAEPPGGSPAAVLAEDLAMAGAKAAYLSLEDVGSIEPPPVV